MTWTAADAQAHSSKANTPAKQKRWAKIANGVRRAAGNDVKAIRVANDAMASEFWVSNVFQDAVWDTRNNDPVNPTVRILGDAVQETSIILFDAVELDDAAKVRFTTDGFMVATPRVARTGIQIYGGKECNRPDMNEVRVYRPADEVFSKEALASFAHRPVTLDHPSKPVNSSNWRELGVGHTGDEILRDGETFRVPMVLMDGNAVAAYKSGKKQLSWGYDCVLDWTPGVTDGGEPYDAVQRSLRANHLAVVTAARAGPEFAIGDANKGATDMTTQLKSVMVDGIECQMTDTAAQIVAKTIGGLTAQIDAFKKKKGDDEDEMEDAAKKVKDALAIIATKDAEIATLKTQLADANNPAKLDQLVKDRSAVYGKARALMGDSLKMDGKTVEQVRREVVDAKLGDVSKGWSDEQISTSFTVLTAGVKEGTVGHGVGANVHDAARAFSRPGGPGYGSNDSDPRSVAYGDYDKRVSDAWMGDKKTA